MPQVSGFPPDFPPSVWGPTRLTSEEVLRIKSQLDAQSSPSDDEKREKSAGLSLSDLPDDGPSGDIEVVVKPSKVGDCCCCGKLLQNNYRYFARPSHIPYSVFKPTAKPDAELVCNLCMAAIAKLTPLSLLGASTKPARRTPLKHVGRKATDSSQQATPLALLSAPREHQLEKESDKALLTREPYHECVKCGNKKSTTGRCKTCTLNANSIKELKVEARSRQFQSSSPTPNMRFGDPPPPKPKGRWGAK